MYVRRGNWNISKILCQRKDFKNVDDVLDVKTWNKKQITLLFELLAEIFTKSNIII